MGRYSPLANLVGRSVEGGLDLYLEVCSVPPSNQGSYRDYRDYRPLSELAGGTDYSVTYLGLLERQGDLDAVKRGDRWYSTRTAIEHYRDVVAHNPLPTGRPRHSPR